MPLHCAATSPKFLNVQYFVLFKSCGLSWRDYWELNITILMFFCFFSVSSLSLWYWLVSWWICSMFVACEGESGFAPSALGFRGRMTGCRRAMAPDAPRQELGGTSTNVLSAKYSKPKCLWFGCYVVQLVEGIAFLCVAAEYSMC